MFLKGLELSLPCFCSRSYTTLFFLQRIFPFFAFARSFYYQLMFSISNKHASIKGKSEKKITGSAPGVNFINVL